MSSADKIETLKLAAAAGYRTYLYFVCTSDPEINQNRVHVRVEQRGHDVPVDKIVERYGRSLKLLPSAIAACDRAFLFDNSGTAHRFIAEYDQGQLIRVADPLPLWFVTTLLNSRPAAG